MELYDPRPTPDSLDLNRTYDCFLLALEHAPPSQHCLVLLGNLIADRPSVLQSSQQLQPLHPNMGDNSWTTPNG
ncbi:hypothetical protein GCM10008957_51060 [Deinococcus ruber]|uniref:Uncharacterized protein n=1 Tax=Deinococcus ruber TaxID=1848197 RepID=A0A918KV56_9DEIO|nr:hypothetical protein GCM10008957_51060 [Deinococcus ruber]